MKLILDTHILLWCLSGDRRLPKAAKQMVEDPMNAVLVSSASVWEIAVKHSIGKIELDMEQLEIKILEARFEPLLVSMRHAIELAGLPMHHRDPFDRMLIAQSRVESAHLLTHDPTLEQYGKVVLVV